MTVGGKVHGIDVSKWQTTTPPLTNHEFLIARATIGTERDAYYGQHIRKARAAGLVTGAYHFNWKSISVSDQVNAFIAAAGNVNLYALDVEGEEAFTRLQAQQFIKLFKERSGKKIGFYHSLSGFYDAGQDWDWVAYWAPQPPSRHWDIWQYGAYNGIDGNRFNGTLAEFHKFAGVGQDVKYIDSTGIAISASRALPVKQGQAWRTFDGTGSGTFSKDATVPVIGRVDSAAGKYACLITTADTDVSKDGSPQPTIVLVQSAVTLPNLNTVALPTPPPPPPAPDCSAQVASAAADAYATGKSDGVQQGINGEQARLRAVLGL